VFTHAVKDEIAPGYRNVVYRPMDLSTIKKNIENSTIKTTKEFQRDIMLMFTNAIMYNSSNHDVYKIALEMYKEVIYNVELLNTQENMNESKPSRFKDSRASTTSDRVNCFKFLLFAYIEHSSKHTFQSKDAFEADSDVANLLRKERLLLLKSEEYETGSNSNSSISNTTTTTQNKRRRVSTLQAPTVIQPSASTTAVAPTEQAKPVKRRKR
jgi:hypothetical protein